MIDKEIGKVIGRRIKMIRQERGFTQDQVAGMLHFSTNHYSAMERGSYGIKTETIVKLINLFECTADDIFCDVINCGYKIRSSRLEDSISKLEPSEQTRIFEVIETMVKSASKG